MDEDDRIMARRYHEIWVCIFTKILRYSDAEVDAWMQRLGQELLDDYDFHEEPWYWTIGEICREFSPTGSVDDVDVSASTREIFPILGNVFYGKDVADLPSDINWDEIRGACARGVALRQN